MTLPIFRWETLQEIGRWMLRFKSPVYGVTVTVELISGSLVRAFRADDTNFYFCHGLTFGGKNAPGGAISPFSGEPVTTILNDLYHPVAEVDALAGDILVWSGYDGHGDHSGILIEPRFSPGEAWLDYASIVRSKNGNQPEAEIALSDLASQSEGYGESYRVYRRNEREI